MKIDFILWLTCAVGVTGCLEWIKGIFYWLPSVVWRSCLPVVSFGVSMLIFGSQGIIIVSTNAIMILAISLLGYKTLISPVLKFIQNKLGGSAPTAADKESVDNSNASPRP